MSLQTLTLIGTLNYSSDHLLLLKMRAPRVQLIDKGSTLIATGRESSKIEVATKIDVTIKIKRSAEASIGNFNEALRVLRFN